MKQNQSVRVIIFVAIFVLVVLAILIFNSILNPAKPADKPPVETVAAGINSALITKSDPTGSAAPTAQVPAAENRLLILSKAANPQTYDHVGQTITYSYVITNGGSVPLGPAQFVVTDSGLDAPLNCGMPDATLMPVAAVSCSAAHVITQADLDAGAVTSSATASGGGAPPSAPVDLTITKSVPAPANPTNLTPGANIQHKVAAGEWLYQIARCYGADLKKIVQANPQLANANQISPGMLVNVPNIGSKGPIHGPACSGPYTVQAGDTWASIAKKFDADANILQRVNPGRLSVGRVLLIPLHSAE